MARITREHEERSSRAASSHMRISDDDVARMPGTNAASRMAHQGYSKRSAYTPLSPWETLQARPIVKSPGKVKTAPQVDGEAEVPLQSWPLPRRLTRSGGTLLANPPVSSTPLRKRNEDREKTPGGRVEKWQWCSRGAKSRPISPEDLQHESGKDAVLGADLRPKPLFYGEQRSTSLEIPPELARSNKATSPDPCNVKDSEPQTLLRVRPSARSCHPRSFSVCSQDAGTPPNLVLPPLPFELSSKVTKNAKSPTDFSTCENLFSDNTSILNDEDSRNLLHRNGDRLTSSLNVAPPNSSATVGANMSGLGLWDHGKGQESPSSVSATRAMKLRPQMNTQKSFRGSIRYTRPRSQSSGLSMALFEYNSCNASDGPSPKESAWMNPTPKTSSNFRIFGKTNNDNVQKASYPSQNTIVAIANVPQPKQAPPLPKPSSGNEGVSALAFPASLATDDPFKYDKQTLRSGDLADEVNGQRRPNGTPISKIPVFVPTPSKSGHTDGSTEMIRRKSTHREATATATAPSKVVFDPQCTPSRHERMSMIQPTMTSCYSDEAGNNSPESALSTPTKKPSRIRSSTILDDSLNKLSHTLSTVVGASDSGSSNIDPESRPPSYLFDFPNPPRPNGFLSWRGPKTPIRGPRLPAPKYNTCSPYRSTSRSPTQSPPKSPKKSPTRSPMKRIARPNRKSRSVDLRRSIMELRRQNSEVNNQESRSSKEHKRYLSIGDDELNDRDGAVFDDLGEGKENEGMGRRRKSSRTTSLLWELKQAGVQDRGSNGVRMESAMSCYDEHGFLKGE